MWVCMCIVCFVRYTYWLREARGVRLSDGRCLHALALAVACPNAVTAPGLMGCSNARRGVNGVAWTAVVAWYESAQSSTVQEMTSRFAQQPWGCPRS